MRREHNQFSREPKVSAPLRVAAKYVECFGVRNPYVPMLAWHLLKEEIFSRNRTAGQASSGTLRRELNSGEE